jgi:hypothetical protein
LSQDAGSPADINAYTPTGERQRDRHVTVQAVDDGGTGFGGDDTSAAQSFAIASPR